MPRQGEHQVSFGWETEAPHTLAVVPITSSGSDCHPCHAQRVFSGQGRCQQTPGARQPRGKATACLLRMLSCLSAELCTHPSHLCISPSFLLFTCNTDSGQRTHSWTWLFVLFVLFLQDNSQPKPKIWCQTCVSLGADPHSPQPCKGKSWGGGHTATFSPVPSTWAFGHRDLFFTSNTPERPAVSFSTAGTHNSTEPCSETTAAPKLLYEEEVCSSGWMEHGNSLTEQVSSGDRVE